MCVCVCVTENSNTCTSEHTYTCTYTDLDAVKGVLPVLVAHLALLGVASQHSAQLVHG